MANSGFQTQVYYQPAPAIQGDFASTNPRAVVLAGPGALVAGPAGVTVGNFCWLSSVFVDGDQAPGAVTSSGTGNVAGFVHREQQALITSYLQTSSMIVPGGFPITVMDQGDFWALNSGSAQALPGQKAYATFADGTVTFGATATPTTGATSSASSVAASTFSVTGSIAGNVLTVTAVGSGVVVPGATISGTNVVTGSMIVSQLSGTAGGIGTYSVNYGEQSVASTTVSGTYGTLTIGGTVAGVFAINQVLTGTGVTAGTTITALGTGTGGAGTYIVNKNTVVSSTAINVSAINVETKWYAASSGLTGELVKITSWVGTQG